MIIISGKGCGICKTVKNILIKKNVEFTEYDYSDKEAFEYIEKANGCNNLPFLFDEKEFYCGMDAVKYAKTK